MKEEIQKNIVDYECPAAVTTVCDAHYIASPSSRAHSLNKMEEELWDKRIGITHA